MIIDDVLLDQMQEIKDLIPSVRTAWLERSVLLEAELSEESNPDLRRTLLNEAAKERLVAPPAGLNQAVRIYYEGKVNVIRSEFLSPLYTTYTS